MSHPQSMHKLHMLQKQLLENTQIDHEIFLKRGHTDGHVEKCSHHCHLKLSIHEKGIHTDIVWLLIDEWVVCLTQETTTVNIILSESFTYILKDSEFFVLLVSSTDSFCQVYLLFILWKFHIQSILILSSPNSYNAPPGSFSFCFPLELAGPDWWNVHWSCWLINTSECWSSTLVCIFLSVTKLAQTPQHQW